MNAYNSQRVYGYFWLPNPGSPFGYRGTGSGTITTAIQTLDTTAAITFEARGNLDSAGSQNFAHHFFTASVYNPLVLT
jgi:hypothetical protein